MIILIGTQYSSPEESFRAKESLSNIVWPKEGKALILDFLHEKELNELIEKFKSNTLFNPSELNEGDVESNGNNFGSDLSKNVKEYRNKTKE